MKDPISDEYENRVIPENIRNTVMDLPGMYSKCNTCFKITNNFTMYPTKPMRICDECYEQCLKFRVLE